MRPQPPQKPDKYFRQGGVSPRTKQGDHRPAEASVDSTDILERHTVRVEWSPKVVDQGNKVTLLADGQATYAAMFKHGNAQDHINLESYIFEEDETGRKFADLLLKKQRQGVQVHSSTTVSAV